MDILDKRIVTEFVRNCRTPLRGLARMCKLSAPSMKKRVAKLQAAKMLSRPYIKLSLAMLDANYCLAWLTTDASEHDEVFFDILGAHPAVNSVARMGPKRVCVISEVAGVEGLSELGRFFRSLDCVTNVDIGLVMPVSAAPATPRQRQLFRGLKVLFTNSQRRVIECLWDDVRMSIKEIAERTRLSRHSVRCILPKLQTEGGLYFTAHPNFHADRMVPFVLVTIYDERRTEPEDIVRWLVDSFPFEYCNTWLSAHKPELIHFCVANDLPTIERIDSVAKGQAFTTHVETSILSAFRFFYGLGYIKLAELLGRSAQNGHVPPLAE